MRELKGDHFIVYHQTSNTDFAAEVLRKAEYHYSQIAADLGYVRYSNFWQWDKRVKIFIYPDQGSFLRATGQPAWSTGNANYTTKQISGFSGSREFIAMILPHEIAHLIFRDFVGFAGEVPLWLDEGVAQWEERSQRDIVKFYVRDLYEKKRLMSLDALTRYDVRKTDEGQEARNFYVQAASLVGFLIERFGTDRFVHFCRQLRDGKALDEALSFAYPTQVRNLSQLEEAWLAYVKDIHITVQRQVGSSIETISY
jgi:hypothetical protein